MVNPYAQYSSAQAQQVIDVFEPDAPDATKNPYAKFKSAAVEVNPYAKFKSSTENPYAKFKPDEGRSFMQSMKERAGEAIQPVKDMMNRAPTTPEKGESGGDFVRRAIKRDIPEGLAAPVKLASAVGGVLAAPGGAAGETAERAAGKALGVDPQKLEKIARDTGDIAGMATVAALPGGKKPITKDSILPAAKSEEAIAPAAAFGKKGSPQPATSKIFTADQPIASTKPVSTVEGVADKLYQSRGAIRADYKEFTKWATQFKAVPKDFWQKALDHLDDPKGVPLSPQEKLIFDRSIGVLRDEIDANRKEIKASGFDPAYLEESDSLGGAIRVRKGMGTPLDRLTGTKTASRPPEGGKSLSRSAGTFKGRTMMALVKDGKRAIVHIDPDGQVFDAARKGEPLGEVDEKTKEFSGAGKLVEATRKEIEGATQGGLQYHDNAFGVYSTSLLQTRRAVRSVRILNDIKKSPDFNQVARLPIAKGKTPDGWREIDYPAFRGWKFEPRYAEEIEDFVHGINRDAGALSKMDKVNRFTLNLLFWANPIHAYNITDAFTVTKGAGALARDLPGTVGDLLKSVKSVATRDKYNMHQARAGVPMPGLDTAGEEFRRMTLDVMGVKARQDPQGFSQFIKEFGFNKAADFFNRVGEVSHKAVFSWQDVLQQTLERGYMRKGMTQAQATEKIAKTFMNYRTPARVMDQRWMGQALQGQAWLDFPKYSYGRLKGLYNILHGSAKLDSHSIDQLMTVAILYEFGKYAIAPLVKKYSGQDNAEFGSFGYTVAPDLAEKLYEGERTPGQAALSMLSPGYMTQSIFAGAGVDPFLAKGVSIPGESAGEIGMDYLSMMANKLSPMQRFGQVASGQITPDDLWLQQLGVKFPGDPSASRTVRRQLKSREKYGSKLEQELGQ